MFLEHFANRTPCRIGMEACGGAQHWARRLIEMGHEVKLMPARFVTAFNTGTRTTLPMLARSGWQRRCPVKRLRWLSSVMTPGGTGTR
jgi:transposase